VIANQLELAHLLSIKRIQEIVVLDVGTAEKNVEKLLLGEFAVSRLRCVRGV
jgi:hypothetical protein